MGVLFIGAIDSYTVTVILQESAFGRDEKGPPSNTVWCETASESGGMSG